MIYVVMVLSLFVATPASAYYIVTWDHPGTNPWRGEMVSAMNLLIDDGAPAEEIEKLAQYFRAYNFGSSYSEPVAQCHARNIHPDESFDKMAAGYGTILHHVIARTEFWPEVSTTDMIECQEAKDGHLYSLIYPWICGNWAFKDEIDNSSLKPLQETSDVPASGGGTAGTNGSAGGISTGSGVGGGGGVIGVGGGIVAAVIGDGAAGGSVTTITPSKSSPSVDPSDPSWDFSPPHISPTRPTSMPEPSSLALLTPALLIALRKWRKR